MNHKIILCPIPIFQLKVPLPLLKDHIFRTIDQILLMRTSLQFSAGNIFFTVSNLLQEIFVPTNDYLSIKTDTNRYILH